MDGNTLFASLVIIALTILLAGGIPPGRATGGDFLSVLRDGSRGQGRRAGRLTRTLVVLEIVLISVVMFIGSVLAVDGHRAAHVERGVDMRNLMVGSVELPADRYTENHKKLAFYDSARGTSAAGAGYQSVVLMATLGDSDRVQFAVDGSEYKLESDYPETFGKATSGSLEPMGIRLIDGRYFDSRDTDTGMKAVIVSESLGAPLFQRRSARQAPAFHRSDQGHWNGARSSASSATCSMANRCRAMRARSALTCRSRRPHPRRRA